MLAAILMLALGPIDVSAAGVREAPSHVALSYDAAEPRGRRKAPRLDRRSEDEILSAGPREKVQASASDLARNFSVAAWAIRRHLDYVATVELYGRNRDEGFDRALEEFFAAWQTEPARCDAAGRHNFARLIRLAEARRTIQGDVGILKLADGRVQGIESDRIRDPQQRPPEENWRQGVRIDAAGRALAYAIHRRGRSGYELERIVSAEHVELLGYYDRYDQVRGISPIVAGLNPLRDVYENFDLALAKAKVTQMFALAIYSNAEAGIGEHTAAADSTDAAPKYDVDLGRGPAKLELDPGDRAEFLESKHPSTEFQAFTQAVIAVALKALDLPLVFYDESHTNFFGSRSAWLQYARACRDKQADLLGLLDRLTLWRLQLAILDGDLTLPSGWTLADVDWEWVPLGIPWWDPAKEIRGDLLAIQAGLDYPQRITKERGRGDWRDNVDRLADAVEYARSKGVRLSFDAGPEPALEPSTAGDAGDA